MVDIFASQSRKLIDVVLKVVAGKDATKPFKKNHNDRILKNWQYKDLCIGKLAEDEAPEKQVGRFSRILSWRKVEKKVLEVKVDVKEVTAENEQAVEEQIEDVAADNSSKQFAFVDVKKTEVVSISLTNGKEKLHGRNTVNVLADDLALVVL